MPYFIMIVCFFMSLRGSGQTWVEWTRQQETQAVYLREQIAALKVYIELGRQGYALYQDGLTLLGDIRSGEFQLHQDYFASLSAVPARFRKLPQLQDIQAWHAQVRIMRRALRELPPGRERVSVQALFDALVQQGRGFVDQSVLLGQDGRYQLSDAQRVRQLASVHTEMSALYSFARSVYLDAFAITGQQEREIRDLRILRGLQDIK